MVIPVPEAARTELRDKRTHLFIHRLRLLLWFGLCADLLFVIEHLFHSYPLDVYVLMGLQAGFCLLALQALRLRQYQHRTPLIALLSETFFCCAAASGAILDRNLAALPQLYIIINLYAAILLPWGRRPPLF